MRMDEMAVKIVWGSTEGGGGAGEEDGHRE